MTFLAGQKVRASALNAAIALAPQYIGMGQVTSGTQPSLSLAIPSGYNFLLVRWAARSDNASSATNMMLQLNSDTGAHYMWEQVESANSTTTATPSGSTLQTGIQIGTMPAASGSTNFFGTGDFEIASISDGVFKTAVGRAAAHTTTTDVRLGTYAGMWQGTAVVTSMTLYPKAGNFTAGTRFSVYGIQ